MNLKCVIIVILKNVMYVINIELNHDSEYLTCYDCHVKKRKEEI